MFDYTKDYLDLLKRDFKVCDLAFGIINGIVTIAYPIFAMVVKLGNLYINIAVLVLALIYVGMQLILGDNKRFKMNRVYSWLRILLSTISLCINIYSIYVATTNVNGVAIILSTIMTIFWILKVLVNLLYDIIMPRLQTLGLCIVEDCKPYASKADFVSELVTNKPLFGFSKETPEEVSKVVSKAKKASEAMQECAINKEINNEYLKLIDDDGNIEVTDLIMKGLSLENVIVDKNRYMHQEFFNTLNPDELDKLIKSGPLKAGLTPMQVSYYVDKLSEGNSINSEIVSRYINDDSVDYKNEKEFKKLLQAFSLTLITMQKIIYMYGFKQIDGNSLSDLDLTALVLALSIALNDSDKIEAKEELLKLKKRDLKDDLFNMAANKLGFMKNHSDEIKSGLLKTLPIAARIMAKYKKGKLGLALKAASLAIDLTKNK